MRSAGATSRWMPGSTRLFSSPLAGTLAAALLTRARKMCFGLDPLTFHRTGRFREELQRALTAAVAEEMHQFDALLSDVARQLGHVEGTALAVQDPPYVRVVPPGAPHAVKDFHWDAYIGHPTQQWGLWIPLSDLEGPEGLWLVEDEAAAPLVAQGALTPTASEALRAAARPFPMRCGEVLVMQSFTAHGSVVHSLDRTRLSVDVRFSLEGQQPSGALGWRARRVVVR